MELNISVGDQYKNPRIIQWYQEDYRIKEETKNSTRNIINVESFRYITSARWPGNDAL